MLEMTMLATTERQLRRQRELTVDLALARQVSRRGIPHHVGLEADEPDRCSSPLTSATARRPGPR